MRYFHSKAFTLAELLIALAILGVIATFTIPKILQTQQDNKKKAVLRETVSALYNAMSDGRSTGTLTLGTHLNNFATRLNYVKACSNSLADGCAWQAALGDSSEPGFLLHNGAGVSGIDPSGNDGGSGRLWNGWTIDWNGGSPPNQVGDDILIIIYCYGEADCTSIGGWFAGADGRPGRMFALKDAVAGTGNVALYQWIYSN